MDRSTRLLTFHSGKRCKRCGRQNFAGLRFHCLRCPDFDLCNNCQDRLVGNHTADHPMQAVMLIKKDSPLFYQSEEFCPQSFTCCFCGQRGLSPSKVVTHFVECIGRHPLPDRPVVYSVCCPLCAAESRCFHPARFDHEAFWSHITERHELYVSFMNNPSLVNPVNLPLPSSRSIQRDLRNFFTPVASPSTSMAATSTRPLDLPSLHNRIVSHLQDANSNANFRMLNVELSPLPSENRSRTQQGTQRPLTLSELIGSSARQNLRPPPTLPPAPPPLPPPPPPTQHELYPLLTEILEELEQGNSQDFSDDARDFNVRVMIQTLVEPTEEFQMDFLFPEEQPTLPLPQKSLEDPAPSEEEIFQKLPGTVSPTALLAEELASEKAPTQAVEQHTEHLLSPGFHCLGFNIPEVKSLDVLEEYFPLQATFSSDLDPLYLAEAFCSFTSSLTSMPAFRDPADLGVGLSEEFEMAGASPSLVPEEVTMPLSSSDIEVPIPLEKTSSEALMLNTYFTPLSPSLHFPSTSSFLAPPAAFNSPHFFRTFEEMHSHEDHIIPPMSERPPSYSDLFLQDSHDYSTVPQVPQETISPEVAPSLLRPQESEPQETSRPSTSMVQPGPSTSYELPASSSLPDIPSDFQYSPTTYSAYSAIYAEEFRNISKSFQTLTLESSTLVLKLRDIHNQANLLAARMATLTQMANTFTSDFISSRITEDHATSRPPPTQIPSLNQEASSSTAKKEAKKPQTEDEEKDS